MTFKFFKHNFYRQFSLYSTVVLAILLLYDAVFVTHSLFELIIAALAGLAAALSLIYQYFNRIIINNDGVEYKSILKNYTLKWDDIGQVKIIPRWKGRSAWIIVLKSKNPKDIYKKKNVFNRHMACITFPLIADAAGLLAKYRDAEGLFDDRLFSSPNDHKKLY